MIQALMWKEYREHRAVWLTLAIGGGAGLFGLLRLMAPEGIRQGDGTHEPLQAVAVLLAWTYGLVCGSMLLAGEREEATMTFLDSLPVCRLELWLVKCLIGLLLCLGQVIALTGFVVLLGIATTNLQTAAIMLAMLLSSLVGLAWGLLFSARGQSVLNTIGLAMAGQIAAVFVLGIVLALVRVLFSVPREEGAFLLLLVVCPCVLAQVVGPIVGSARVFSQLDRLRGLRAKPSVPQRAPERNVWASWGRLLWLSYRQMRRLILGLVLFALALGLLLPMVGPAAWPVLTLIIGILCGVSVFGDEQMNGSFRFLGDQRLPLGRVWLVKVSLRWTLAVFAAVLLVLPSAILTIVHAVQPHSPQETREPFFGEVLHSALVGLVAPAGVYLTLWLMYGFTVGHLCGLLFRKSLVAAVVSLGAASTLVSLWIPSLLGMGLHFWQVAGVPAILLGTSWLLVPAWAAGRLLARGTFLRLGAALATVVLWNAASLWYRVAEVPQVPDRFDMPAFAARLPAPENNEAGQAVREASSHVDKLMRLLSTAPARQPLVADFPPEGPSLVVQVGGVLQSGWPAEPIELGDWLDQHFQEEDQEKWLDPLTRAADCPVGTIEHVKNMTFDTRLDSWHNNAVLFNQVLAARGLQRQARGDQKTFVDYLRIGLAVSRNMQNLSPPLMALQGRRAERVWPPALALWLTRLQGPPEAVREQLQRVLAALRQHENELPDETDPVKVAYLIAANSLDSNPGRLLARQVFDRPRQDTQLRQAELDVASLLWRIPWEQERHRRILRAAFEGDEPQRRAAREWGRPIAANLGIRLDFPARNKRDVAELRAAQLKVALREYQAQTGELPEKLDALVPRYLPAIPADPFDNHPFRYRRSHGEEIGWFDVEEAAGAPARPGVAPPGAAPAAKRGGGKAGLFGAPPFPKRPVREGQGILWSVGEDGHDDGGIKQSKNSGTIFGEDIIFLVAPPG